MIGDDLAAGAEVSSDEEGALIRRVEHRGVVRVRVDGVGHKGHLPETGQDPVVAGSSRSQVPCAQRDD